MPIGTTLVQLPATFCFPAHYVLGQQKGLAEKLSLSDHTSLPPAPHGACLPSHACGFVAPFWLEARAVIVCSAQEGNHSGRGVLPTGAESSPGPLASQSLPALLVVTGAGGSVLEAVKLCAAGCRDQCSFPARLWLSTFPWEENWCPGGILAISACLSGLVGHPACLWLLG